MGRNWPASRSSQSARPLTAAEASTMAFPRDLRSPHDRRRGEQLPCRPAGHLPARYGMDATQRRRWVKRAMVRDWAWLSDVGADGDPDDDRWHSLLICRNSTTDELPFYRYWTTGPATLAQPPRVAGARWIVEQAFQAALGQVGLDQHRVRAWTSWHRFRHSGPGRPRRPGELRRRRAHPGPLRSARYDRADRQRDPPPDQRPADPADRQHAHQLRWSNWRRRHQAGAKRVHHACRFISNPAMIRNGSCRTRLGAVAGGAVTFRAGEQDRQFGRWGAWGGAAGELAGQRVEPLGELVERCGVHGDPPHVVQARRAG